MKGRALPNEHPIRARLVATICFVLADAASSRTPSAIRGATLALEVLADIRRQPHALSLRVVRVQARYAALLIDVVSEEALERWRDIARDSEDLTDYAMRLPAALGTPAVRPGACPLEDYPPITHGRRVC